MAEGEGVHGVRWERAGFAFGSSRQVEEAARLLGEPVSRTTIRKWAREGHVVAHLQDDGTQLYSLAEVLDYARRWRLQLDEASS